MTSSRKIRPAKFSLKKIFFQSILKGLKRVKFVALKSTNAPPPPYCKIFCRTYLPSQVPRVVEMWKQELGKVSEKAAKSLADPLEYSNLFPDYAASLQAEQLLSKERSQIIPASDYLEILVSLS